MQNSHKNKTFAALLGLMLGGAGVHRFYLQGMKDIPGWLHAASVLFSAALFIIGLMSDEKWDALYNAESGKTSDTGWPVALLMVMNLANGATLMLIALARSFDLILTGGSYG